MKLIILVGLPASGKTTFANKYKEEIENKRPYRTRSCRDNFNVIIVDLDGVKNPTEHIIRNIGYRNEKDDIIILDGLFFTNEDIAKALSVVESRREIDTIEVHFWKPDVDKCLWNDTYRRDTDSEITIRNATVEYPNIDFLRNELGGIEICIVEHEIVEKPEWKAFAGKFDIYLENEIYMGSKYGDSWCLGGTYENCWGSGGRVSADPIPETFEAFDSLIEKICPSVSFLQYKKLYRECVTVEEYEENDYYGGSTDHAFYRCNVPCLYNMLIEMGLFSADEL